MGGLCDACLIECSVLRNVSQAMAVREVKKPGAVQINFEDAVDWTLKKSFVIPEDKRSLVRHRSTERAAKG